MTQKTVQKQKKKKKTWEQLVQEGRQARESKDDAQWKLGDLANTVETEYGEQTLKNYADEINVKYNSLYVYKRVSKKFEFCTRVQILLPWSFFRLVVNLDFTVALALLKKAKANNWTYRELENAVKLFNEKPFEPLPKGIYDVIYADPPWSFRNWTSFSPEKHYWTLSTEKIKELSALLNQKVAKNAVLFLWTPNGILEEALEVMRGWGFEYKTNVVWVKRRQVYDYRRLARSYIYSKHELLLIGTKGAIGTPLEENRPVSVIDTSNERMKLQHSEKPSIVYEVIEKMYPDHKYLELFARQRRKNWESWGDEIQSEA